MYSNGSLLQALVWEGGSEHVNETLPSIKGGQFLAQLSDYQLLKEDSALYGYSVGYLLEY
jgi:hypothetical protein